MATSRCVQVTKAQPSLNITSGSYLDPWAPQLAAIPSSEQVNQCSPYPWLPFLWVMAYMLFWSWGIVSLVVGVLIDSFKKAYSDDEVTQQVGGM
jgi:hypothetical protein